MHIPGETIRDKAVNLGLMTIVVGGSALSLFGCGSPNDNDATIQLRVLCPSAAPDVITSPPANTGPKATDRGRFSISCTGQNEVQVTPLAVYKIDGGTPASATDAPQAGDTADNTLTVVVQRQVDDSTFSPWEPDSYIEPTFEIWRSGYFSGINVSIDNIESVDVSSHPTTG